MLMHTSKRRVVGVNIGMDATSFAIVDVRGNVIAQDEFPTLEHPNINEYVTYLSEKLVELMENNGGYDTIRSVGVGVLSGNFVKGNIEHSPCLPWKGEVPLASMLRDQLGMAVAVGNNAHVRALGEQAFGKAHGMSDFIVITLGVGMGSCVFSNGRPHLGHEGFAGEVGHICVNPNGRLCGCGGQGCMETYCSEDGIILTARKMMKKTDTPSKLRLYDILDINIINECAEQGDELAKQVLHRTGEILGIGMANYASVISPEAIIFTGSVARSGQMLFNSAKEAFEENVFHNMRGKVKFLTSTFTDMEQNVLGASALAWQVKEYSLFK
ncbi:MAG: ROK family protein [Prevotella sp.]|nr:ROK family protein [Prevotella sp.]